MAYEPGIKHEYVELGIGPQQASRNVVFGHPDMYHQLKSQPPHPRSSNPSVYRMARSPDLEMLVSRKGED